LSVQHNREEIYPAIVTAQGLTITKTIKKAGITFIPSEEETIKRDVDTKTAYSENEFVVILKEVLQAPQTIAMLQSLIARSNEATNPTETLEETDTDEAQEHKQNLTAK